MSWIIGVDLDNTIISYDESMVRLAKELGMDVPETARDKKEIRDAIRSKAIGDLGWQKLQGLAYGPRINDAHLIHGIPEFFKSCRKEGIKAYIVSHKTEYAAQDESRTNLRLAALGWLESNGFFESDGIGLSRDDVFFESTRRDKVARIIRLNCSHFIDDLEETFEEESFPAAVQKILFSPAGNVSARANEMDLKICSSWMEISNYVFRK